MTEPAPEPDVYEWLDLQEALEERDRKYRAENDPESSADVGGRV